MSNVEVISDKENQNYSPCADITSAENGSNGTVAGSGADFEKAIAATRFGYFNLLLFLTAVPSILTTQFEITSLAFVFPAAQCDLNLSLEDRGFINAIIYIGMIFSSFLWGSLVDVIGRRKILIISYSLDCIFVIMAALSSNFTMLVVAKFFGGFLINGPLTAMTPYYCEFHATQYRARVPLTIGLLYSFINIFMPLLAWLILPLDINFQFFGGIEIHAWNVFLLLCAAPGFISSTLFFLMPESPKYLMTKGKNDEALRIFKKIYRVNTKQSDKNYPIDKLADEQQIYQKKKGFKDAWKQISPLFTLKYASKLIVMCLLMMCLMMCISTLYLWLPEIFQIVNDYEYYNNSTATFCEMLRNNPVDTISDLETCHVNFENDSVYINSVIVGACTVCAYLVAAALINKLGKKKVLCFQGFVSGVCAFCVYFAPNSLTALILICFYVMCNCVCVDIVITFIIDLFPTSLRGTAFSMALMCARIGSILGNLVFPYLLQAGCAPPFFTIGSIVIGCTIISLFLPNTDFKALD